MRFRGRVLIVTCLISALLLSFLPYSMAQGAGGGAQQTVANEQRITVSGVYPVIYSRGDQKINDVKVTLSGVVKAAPGLKFIGTREEKYANFWSNTLVFEFSIPNDPTYYKHIDAVDLTVSFSAPQNQEIAITDEKAKEIIHYYVWKAWTGDTILLLGVGGQESRTFQNGGKVPVPFTLAKAITDQTGDRVAIMNSMGGYLMNFDIRIWTLNTTSGVKSPEKTVTMQGLQGVPVAIRLIAGSSSPAVDNPAPSDAPSNVDAGALQDQLINIIGILSGQSMLGGVAAVGVIGAIVGILLKLRGGKPAAPPTKEPLQTGPRDGETRTVKDHRGEDMDITYDAKSGEWLSSRGTTVDLDKLDKAREDYTADREFSDREHERLIRGDTAFDRKLKEMQDKADAEARKAQEQMDLRREEYRQWLQERQASKEDDAARAKAWADERDRWVRGAEYAKEAGKMAAETLAAEALVALAAARLARGLSKAAKAAGKVPELNVTVPANKSAFWSGKEAAKKAAESGRTLVNQTPSGKFVEGTFGAAKDVPWSIQKQSWSKVSAEYARQAKGTVEVYLDQGMKAGSVFTKTELPILLKNPNVTHIKTFVKEGGKWVEKSWFKPRV